MADVAVIIPAYNEGPRVASVVRAAVAARLPKRVVVVDDGSSDDTVEAARAAGAHVLVLRPNRGKAGAMDAGVVAVCEDGICFLDADLVGLRPDHVDRLIEPWAHGEAKMVVGALTSGDAGLSQAIVTVLSGQRVLSRTAWAFAKLVEPSMLTSRFGVEVALSVIANRYGWDVATVSLDGLGHTQKETKWGTDGLPSRLKMWGNVVRAARRVAGKRLWQDLLRHVGSSGYAHRVASR